MLSKPFFCPNCGFDCDLAPRHNCDNEILKNNIQSFSQAKLQHVVSCIAPWWEITTRSDESFTVKVEQEYVHIMHDKLAEFVPANIPYDVTY